MYQNLKNASVINRKFLVFFLVLCCVMLSIFLFDLDKIFSDLRFKNFYPVNDYEKMRNPRIEIDHITREPSIGKFLKNSRKFTVRKIKKDKKKLENLNKIYTTSSTRKSFSTSMRSTSNSNMFDIKLNMETINRGLNFDISKNALAFMHIQKTSGKEFDKIFVENLLIQNKIGWKNACKKKMILLFGHQRYDCKFGNSKYDWYLSRVTNGWPCEIHANYAQIKNCFPRRFRKYSSDDIIVFTILREPVRRYLSEWNHVKRVGIWPFFITKTCVAEKYYKCHKNTNRWKQVSLENFIECEYNLASNRQTKHLAYYDSSYSICNMVNNDEENQKILLEKAKKTLDQMPFFGINEYYNYSLALFEKTIGNNLFKFDLNRKKTETKKNTTFAKYYEQNLNENLLNKIKILNKLDIELYQYGLKLFFAKLKYFNII